MKDFNMILKHELKINFRTKESFYSMLSFGMVLIVALGFTLNTSPEQLIKILPGMFWITVLFISVIGIYRMFAHEMTFNAISLFASSPINRSLILFTKVISGLVYLFIVELVLLGLIKLFFDVFFLDQLFLALGLIFIGNFSILITGVLLSGLTLNSQMKDVLIPILMFPLLSPVIIALTKSTQSLLEGIPIDQWQIWIFVIITYSIVFSILGYGFFDYFMEE